MRPKLIYQPPQIALFDCNSTRTFGDRNLVNLLGITQKVPIYWGQRHMTFVPIPIKILRPYVFNVVIGGIGSIKVRRTIFPSITLLKVQVTWIVANDFWQVSIKINILCWATIFEINCEVIDKLKNFLNEHSKPTNYFDYLGWTLIKSIWWQKSMFGVDPRNCCVEGKNPTSLLKRWQSSR